jgi:DNA-binding MarR family transcriptional regulator
MSRFYDACLAEVGLRGTQYGVLLYLSRHGAVSVNELAEILVMDRTTVAHNLQPLKRDGLVSVEVSGQDRRARCIALSESGRQRLRDGQAAWSKAQRLFEEKFGQARAQAMRKMMAEIVAPDLRTK